MLVQNLSMDLSHMDTGHKDQLVAMGVVGAGMDHAWNKNFVQILQQFIK